MRPHRTCDSCRGAWLEGTHCLAHLTPDELAAVLARLRDGAALDARDITISGAGVTAFLRALPVDEHGRTEVPRLDVGGATFTDDVDFGRAVFTHDVRFSEAIFRGKLQLRGALFLGDTRFRDTRFDDHAAFSHAVFMGAAFFVGASFQRDARFTMADVKGTASFTRAAFIGDASFTQAVFGRTARFRRVTFHHAAKFRGATFRAAAEFGATSFGGAADLSDVRFEGPLVFEGAQPAGAMTFARTCFLGDARFRGVTFGGATDFTRAIFGDSAVFSDASFRGPADFSDAGFDRSANFGGASFRGAARYSGVRFGQEARFDGARFGGVARFAATSFGGETRFRRAWFGVDARFQRAVFHRSRELGPLSAGAGVILDGAVFHDHVNITVRAPRLTASGATFFEGTHVHVQDADVALDGADFARPSTLYGPTARQIETHLILTESAGGRLVSRYSQPRLLSVRSAHVAPLALANVDLRACLFFGAHGLESMRAESSCTWPSAPASWWLCQRATIAEEHRWRDAAASTVARRPTPRRRSAPTVSDWCSAPMRPPAWFEDRDADRVLEPQQISAIYRALRKAREDGKDEARSGDLYYGEMEMRRHATSGTGHAADALHRYGERAVLRAYWLLSGYGLRAWRALGALGITLVLAAVALQRFGFHEHRGYGRALLFALESSVNWLRPPTTTLSAGGQLVEIALRLAGPLFVGLALLAIRARVKR